MHELSKNFNNNEFGLPQTIKLKRINLKKYSEERRKQQYLDSSIGKNQMQDLNNYKTPLKKSNDINRRAGILDLNQISRRLNFNSDNDTIIPLIKNEQKKKRILCEVTINLGKEGQRMLIIYENDDISELAKSFCRINNLEDNAIFPLIMEISKQILKSNNHNGKANQYKGLNLDELINDYFVIKIILPNNIHERLIIYENTSAHEMAIMIKNKHDLNIEEMNKIQNFIIKAKSEYFSINQERYIELLEKNLSLLRSPFRLKDKDGRDIHQDYKFKYKKEQSPNLRSNKPQLSGPELGYNRELLMKKTNSNVGPSTDIIKKALKSKEYLIKQAETESYENDKDLLHSHFSDSRDNNMLRSDFRSHSHHCSRDKVPIENQFTFKPKIDKHSQKLAHAANRRHASPIFIRLLESGIKSDQKKTEYIQKYFDENYPFKPNTPHLTNGDPKKQTTKKGQSSFKSKINYTSHKIIPYREPQDKIKQQESEITYEKQNFARRKNQFSGIIESGNYLNTFQTFGPSLLSIINKP